MTDTNQAKRASIAAKIRALMAKTTDRGCTEAEAVAASDMASRLMAEYDVSYVDIEGEIAAEVFGANRRTFFGGSARKRTMHPVQFCLVAVGAFWDCRVWTSGCNLFFFGEKSDTENAHAMADMFRVTMDAEYATYLRTPGRARGAAATIRSSFMSGMVRRLDVRIRDMKAERTAADTAARPTATGSALVIVVKTRIVAEKFASYKRSQGLRLSKSKTRRSSVGSSAAYAAGQSAGGRADLGGSKLAGGHRMIGRG